MKIVDTSFKVFSSVSYNFSDVSSTRLAFIVDRLSVHRMIVLDTGCCNNILSSPMTQC